MGVPSAIHVKPIAKDVNYQTSESLLTLNGHEGKITRAVWGPLNKTIISVGEDAVIRLWDSETGQLIKDSETEMSHSDRITSLEKSKDGSHFLTGSRDKFGKL